jgi:hypothetical protein
MPRTTQDQSGDGAISVAQGRFTVALPRDVGDQIDALAVKMAETMRQQYGIGVQLSRAQVVQSLVTSALDAFNSGNVPAGA